MKNRLLQLSLVMLLGSTVNAYAAHTTAFSGKGALAPDRVDRFDVGVGIAGALNDGAENATFISASAAYGVTPYLAIGVEGGWQEADGNATDETVGYVPILADIIVRVPNVHETIVPYGILGLGIAGVYVADSDGSGNNNGNDSYDTGFAWKLGAGFDWFLNANWIFNGELAFWDADVNLPLTSFGDRASFWTIGVALKYMF